MLEEKNDNLLNADGNENSISQEAVQLEIQDSKIATPVTESIPDTEVEAPFVAETEQETVPEIEDLVGEEIAENPISDKIEVATTASLEQNNDAIIDAIANVNAEESEDETLRHEIPMLDYETLSMEALVAELEVLAAN